MVERLKDAIKRARERRGEPAPSPAAAGPRAAPAQGDTQVWQRLEDHVLDPDMLLRERIVTPGKTDPSHTAFDMLRTRLTKAALSRGIRHIGVTSPTKGCGKTVVSANLAFSFARNPENSVLLLDLDMRSPRLSRILGLRDRRSIRWLLEGSAEPDDFVMRAGERLGLALSAEIVHDSSELLQARETALAIERLDRIFAPDLVIYDLPPMLIGDEMMSLVPHLDGVLMVIAAGQTKPEQVEECETLLEEEDKLIGIILNKAAPDTISNYYYNYGYGYGLD